MAAAFSLRLPSAGTGMSGVMFANQPSSVNHSVTARSEAPVCTASAAGPAAIRAFSPKKSTSTPLSVRSRSQSRHTRCPARSRWASTPNTFAPPSGSTSMPRPSRNATNMSNTDSGLSRSATVVKLMPRATTKAPATSQLPMCGSAKMTPWPLAASVRACSPTGLTFMSRRMRSMPTAGSRNISIQ